MEKIVCMQSQKAMHISIYIFFPISQLGTYTKKMSFTVCKALNFVIFCWCWMSCSSVGCSVWKLLWKDALSLSLSAFVPIFPRLCSFDQSVRMQENRYRHFSLIRAFQSQTGRREEKEKMLCVNLLLFRSPVESYHLAFLPVENPCRRHVCL